MDAELLAARAEPRKALFAGIRVTALWTLASRVLGMFRDIATAALLGMATGGVMDAFVIAVRIPNLFRRLFGEGALAISFLPVFSERLDRDRRSAWQLASVTMTWLAVGLAIAVLLGEIAIFIARHFAADRAETHLMLGLASVMLPYVVLVYLSAQISATLHALGNFSVPAMAPVVLNLAWISGAWVIAPYWSSDKDAQAYVLAVCILAGGAIQLAMQIIAQRRAGFRYDYNWQASREALAGIAAALVPMVVGLAVPQINTLVDSLFAWFLSSPNSGDSIAWLGGVGYPVQQGAAAAIYFGQRLYQFPLGIVGVAVATVIYPLLSRHAARCEHEKIGADLTLGLRLVLFLAVPASAGLILLAEPLARLLFQHGEFTAEDARRTANMIACYGGGAWAYCALPVLVRGYYAAGNRATPVKIGIICLAANFALNAALIWRFAEAGLATSTAFCAGLQVVLLTAFFGSAMCPLDWPSLLRTLAQSIVSMAVMAVAVYGVLLILPVADGLAGQLLHVGAAVAVSVVVYFTVLISLGGREPLMLFRRSNRADSSANRL